MDYFQKKRGLQNDGRMVKRFRTRSRMILTAVCVLMLVMAAGCGKVEEPVPVDLSSGDMEELQNGTAEDTGDDGVSGQDENGMENDAAEEADADADEEDSAGNGSRRKPERMRMERTAWMHSLPETRSLKATCGVWKRTVSSYADMRQLMRRAQAMRLLRHRDMRKKTIWSPYIRQKTVCTNIGRSRMAVSIRRMFRRGMGALRM